MDKTTLSKHGWIIITMVIITLIVVAAPQIGDSITHEIIQKVEDKNTAYEVTLDPNGGIVNIDTLLVVTGKQYGYLPTPSRGGKVFTGWYTAPTGGQKIISQTVYNGTSTHTLYARWE